MMVRLQVKGDNDGAWREEAHEGARLEGQERFTRSNDMNICDLSRMKEFIQSR